MRSGSSSLTQFIWFAVPAFILAGAFISIKGAGLAGLVTVYVVMKVCNALDRAEIRSDSKPQSKGRSSSR